jgi:lactoylglutathione lyase
MYVKFTFAALMCAWAVSARAEQTNNSNGFASTTIDMGIVVSSLDKSVRFYTEAIGFKEAKGFDVSGDYGKKVGLTPGKELKIRVLVLGDGASATKLKLMEFADQPPKKNDNEYISSELGFRYLTVAINDTTTALKRLERAKVEPIANGPHSLPKGFPEGVFLTIVRDPDGNFVELVGPKK